MDRRVIVLTFTGILLFIIYLIWANPFIILFEVGRLNLFYYLLAVLIDQISLIFFAASWWILLKVMNIKISFLEGIQLTYTSLFVGWIIPIPLNTEVVRAYLLNLKKKSNLGTAISSVVTHRAFYNIAFGLSVGLATLFIILINKDILPIEPWLIIFAVCFAIFTSIFFAALLNSSSLKIIYNHSPEIIKKRFFDNLIDFEHKDMGFQGFVNNIEEANRLMKNNSLMTAFSFIFIFLHWIGGSITAYYSAKSLGVELSYPILILIYSVVEFIQQINIFIPSGLGVIDAGLTGAFVLVGIPLHLAASISLLTRLATYWFEVILCTPIAFNFGFRELFNKKNNL
ncbi:flippase-like domain-containing protein [Candidatus Bathyarchaeota archaeon]|nr:flippase-like domain-containing protein [Candidatus Bathyarchaeota archaeon]